MDEPKSEVIPGTSLPNLSFVYRQVQKDLVEKDKFTPKIKGFTLSTQDKEQGFGLSVDYSSLTTPEEIIARVGASFKKDSVDYKDYTKKDIYSLSVNFLKSIESVLDVVYDPIFNSTPKKGFPNNPSHSLVLFSLGELEKNETEIYTRIREHAKDKKQNINLEKVESLLQVFRNSTSV